MRRKRAVRAGALQAVIPVKDILAKSSLFFVLSLAVMLLLMGKVYPYFTESLRARILDVTVPVLEVMSQPVNSVMAVGAWIDEMAHLRSENLRLREENTRLLRWQLAARQLEAENEAFRNLLRFTPPPGASYSSAKIVGDTGGPYTRVALLSAGANQGVAKAQAVLNDQGLVGRVLETGNNSARVLLVTDINSHIPVISEQSRLLGVVAGNNSEQPEVLYLPKEIPFVEKERLLTSGDGGMFPPGIPVGELVTDSHGAAKVRPFVDFHRLEYVRIVNYKMEDSLPGPKLPLNAAQ